MVCFRSAPIDTEGVYHALIQVSDDGGHLMPPTATVTLETVQSAGEWEANGHKVKRRLFTVSVAYKVSR